MDDKLKILIVDDLPANLSALEQLLEDIDVDIIKAADGNDAVGKAFENKFDLILMDVQMPGMNGFEAVNLIKKEEKNKYIPIIFLTAAYIDEISKIEGIQAGAVDYITKPISEEILLGKVKLFLDMQKNKKELEKAKRKLEIIVFTDSLTGVINRKPFTDLLEQNIQRAIREKNKLALLFLDLEKFKQINDIYGHESGDKILVKAAEKFKKTMRKSDFLGRIGGDEFVLCLNDIKSVAGAVQAARRINKDFLEKVKVGNNLIDLTVSIGIAVYPTDGENAAALLKNSDIAMYKAKRRKRNSFQLYSKELTHELVMEQALLKALENNEFSLHYQPIVNREAQIVFIEALLRWHNPDFGSIPPSTFIPLLEKNKVITKVGKWVFREACKQLVIINKNKKYQNLFVSINLSEIQIHDEDFIKDFDNIVQETAVNLKNVVLEITEERKINDLERVINVLTELKKKSVGILALDDFGSGYSSFTNLLRLPIGIVKIDKFIVDNLNFEKYSDATLQMISLIKNLNLKVVAEGVETKEQFELLKKTGCDYFQGFYFAKPQKDIVKYLGVLSN